jgi:hypothetical protein
VSTGFSPVADFLATERCGACGAQAYVETRTHRQGMDNTGMLWCAHHFNQSQMHLLATGARVARDTRDSRATSDDARG